MDRGLSRKQYNRAVRYVKLVYEALFRLLIEKLNHEYDDMPFFNDITEELKEVNANLCQDKFEELMNSDKVIKYKNIVLDYVDKLSESEGSLAKVWLSFIEMAKILLNLLTATRSGNWHLFLETIRDIPPYTFAYDNINYSRYLTVMLAEMVSLETENPDVYQQFMEDNFTAQLSEHSTFGHTVHSDTQYIRTHSTFGHTVHSDTQYIRTHSTFGHTVHSDTQYIRTHSTFGHTVHSDTWNLIK